MSYEKYVGSEMGRTFLISGILALVLGYIAVLIPLAPADQSAWYNFLYEDVTVAAEDRFNVALVIIESLLFTLFYFFLTVSLASYAELQNQIPSWSQLLISAIVTFIGAYIIPQISVGEASLIGGTSGSGFNHFTPDMQTWVIVGTIIGMILMTFYLFYTSPQEE